MPSTRDINIVQAAIEVCTNEEFKRDVLLMSDIKLNKDPHERKQDLDQTIENAAHFLLGSYALEGQQLEKAIGTVFAIVMRILAWTVHYEGTFDIPRELCINLLNTTLFTEEGILDEGKVAQELMRDESLTFEQKFQLASFYCIKDQIPSLFRKIKGGELYNEITRENSKLVKQPGIVVFWTYFAMGEINALKGSKSVDQCRFDMSIESGSKLAVAYCLEKSSLNKKKDPLTDAVVDILMIETRKGSKLDSYNLYFDDWIVFRGKKYHRSEQLWIPSHWLVDILYLLISNMTNEQIKAAFKKFFLSLKYTDTLQDFQSFLPIKEIVFLFRWPHQNRFMELIKSLWDILPERVYTYLLLQVCDKIDPSPFYLLYGEEKFFDYRKLLMELWHESPNRFKRYVFREKEIVSMGKTIKLTDGKTLLTKLFRLSNFNDEDRLNIGVILSSLSPLEKKNIITSAEGLEICKDLVLSRDIELFEELVSNCFDSVEKALEFKEHFYYIKAKYRWYELMNSEEWDAAEESVNCFELSESSLKQVKEKILYSKKGKSTCLKLYPKYPEISERIMKWALVSEESVKIFKKELIFSKVGISECQRLVEDGSIEVVDYLAKKCTVDRSEYVFKTIFAEKAGLPICESLILGSALRTPSVEKDRQNFKGGRWQELDKFLNWCYSDEANINKFKVKLLNTSGHEIHLELIRCNQRGEAENFFSWLGLSEEKIKLFKKQTFSCEVACDMFQDLLVSGEGDAKFTVYGGKREAIENVLTWFLTDIEAIREFRNRYRHHMGNELVRNTITLLRTRFETS